ncbi:pleckstrin domain-containing protein [Heterostelium album PN500]|uniref:Pleckstrin domain-containing protein n=1 Tax=Heterostelium pallidum (strain ATCC 26659 / Pp 5 / PN500) TaxID=670386 RepID=D3B6I6_HETP5|nr:pleckstrin domain-containing protein [Heterostelium album PN500]EFA82956.1 pleckstrin domain-containing protein [Heterostelium album PN500]|eukprot:XP_020435073.1 pleckstrin domain-containing protein [Heterostelium album PN500]
MSESSWLGIWEGNEDDNNDKGIDLKRNIGDWTSFMFAMDEEGGQELHRSLSSFKLGGDGMPFTSAGSMADRQHKLSLEQIQQQQQQQQQQPSLQQRSRFRGSGGFNSPPSFDRQNSSGSGSSQSSFVPERKNSGGIQNGIERKNSSGSNNSSPRVTTNSTSVPKIRIPGLSGAISAGGLNIDTADIFQPASPSSPIPTTPSRQSNGSNQHSPVYGSTPVAASPPLSSSPSSEKDSFFNFFRKKKSEGMAHPNSNSGGPGGKRSSIPSLTLDTISDVSSVSSFEPTSPREVSLNQSIEEPSLTQSLHSDKIMEGWLERSSSRTSWKKHWYILRGNCLEYYKGWWEDKPTGNNGNQPSTPRGDKEKEKDKVKENRITLNYWFTLSKITFEDGKHVFSINHSSEVEKVKAKLLKFRCDDEATAKKWVIECESVIKRKKETTVTLRPLLAADHKLPGGRRATVAAPPTFLPNGAPSKTVYIPSELLEDLEPDEKKVLETVKLLLEEFSPAALPPDEKPSTYRNKPRSTDGFYRILSLDGGGLRSVMVCVLIERIVKRYPTFLDFVDVFTGTSAGSIVAAGLAAQYPPKGTRRVLELTALPVFGKKRPGFNMGNAKFFNRLLRASCYVFFQDKKFYEMPRKLVVPAFQLDSHYPPQAEPYAPKDRRWMPQVFHNIGKCDDWLTQEVVSDVLLRSGSAPTFFPSYQGFIDGGVFCNNPGMAALSLAMSPQLDNIPSSKIICFSLGTGLSPHYMEGGPDYDWGLLNWAPKLGNLFMGSQVDFLTQLCENILAERYHRVNPLLGTHTSMDDPKLVSELATLANEVDLTKTFEWIEKHWFPSNVENPKVSSPRDNQSTTSSN